MANSVVAIRILAAAAVFSITTAGGAAQAAQEFEVYGSIQSLAWRELDDAGGRLLKESGPLFGIGGTFRYQESDSRIVLRARADFFGGRTDYEGREPGTTGPSPLLRTDARYFGSQEQGDIGWELKIGGQTSLVFFGGGGVRTWLRSLEQAYAADGTLQNDYTEFWTSTFVKAGLWSEISFGESSMKNVFFEAAVRVPVFTAIDVLSGEDDDQALRPRIAPSLYAEAGIRVGVVRSSIFYEGLRFDPSSKKTDAVGVVHFQPKSEADIIGIRAGIVF